jgi:hypothetical protein
MSSPDCEQGQQRRCTARGMEVWFQAYVMLQPNVPLIKSSRPPHSRSIILTFASPSPTKQSGRPAREPACSAPTRRPFPARSLHDPRFRNAAVRPCRWGRHQPERGQLNHGATMSFPMSTTTGYHYARPGTNKDLHLDL